MGRVILVLQDKHQELHKAATPEANMVVVGCLQGAPMADRHLAVPMVHHRVEGLTVTLPLGLLTGCMEEALLLGDLMDNPLLIHMAPLSLDPMGQEGLEQLTSPLV